MLMKVTLSEEDQARIRDAVAEAETKTAGEIVPYVVRNSGTYEVALWKAAGLGVAATFAVLALFTWFYDPWGDAWWRDAAFQTLALVAVGTTMAALVWLLPPVRRPLAGNKRMIRNVHRRAMASFVEKEVFNTRDRSGILLFVSLFERRIEVVGDAGINAKVSQDDWVEVVTRIRDGIKAGRLADGLVQGIHLCGELLAKSGVEIRPDDINELSDNVTLDL